MKNHKLKLVGKARITNTHMTGHDYVKREIESLNNYTMSNCIKVKINNMQNSKCKPCDERNEIDDHITSECTKLKQKIYWSRNDWIGKMTHWDF